MGMGRGDLTPLKFISSLLHWCLVKNRPEKLLFVCSQNRWRSLTAQEIYRDSALYQVKSAGTDKGARIRLTVEHIGWADRIFVMEKKHLDRVRHDFGTVLDDKKLICLHIPDSYQYMDPKLVELLKDNLSPFVEVPD